MAAPESARLDAPFPPLPKSDRQEGPKATMDEMTGRSLGERENGTEARRGNVLGGGAAGTALAGLGVRTAMSR